LEARRREAPGVEEVRVWVFEGFMRHSDLVISHCTSRSGIIIFYSPFYCTMHYLGEDEGRSALTYILRDDKVWEIGREGETEGVRKGGGVGTRIYSFKRCFVQLCVFNGCSCLFSPPLLLLFSCIACVLCLLAHMAVSTDCMIGVLTYFIR